MVVMMVVPVMMLTAFRRRVGPVVSVTPEPWPDDTVRLRLLLAVMPANLAPSS